MRVENRAAGVLQTKSVLQFWVTGMGWSDVLRRRRAPKEGGDDTLNVVGRAEAMAAHLGGADTLFRPSEFWRDLSAQNVAMIRANGIGNFNKNHTEWLNERDAFTFRSTSLQAPKGWHAAFDRPADVIDSFTEKLFLPH